MDFKTEKYNDILVLYVSLTRATFNESEKFKTFLSNEIGNGSAKLVVDLSE